MTEAKVVWDASSRTVHQTCRILCGRLTSWLGQSGGSGGGQSRPYRGSLWYCCRHQLMQTRDTWIYQIKLIFMTNLDLYNFIILIQGPKMYFDDIETQSKIGNRLLAKTNYFINQCKIFLDKTSFLRTN